MEENYDKNKIIECMFDQVTSDILLELKDGEKDLEFLMEKLELSENEIEEKLSYLLEHKFVIKQIKENKKIYSVNGDKLTKVMEDDKNFQSVVDGLTEMDSYLN